MLRLEPGKFFGRCGVIRDTLGALLCETQHEGSTRTPVHAHELPYFCIVEDGMFTEATVRRARECRIGTVIFNPAYTEHADEFSTVGSRCFIVQLGGEWAGEPLTELANVGWSSITSPAASWIGARLAFEARTLDPVSNLALEGLIYLLVAEFSRTCRDRVGRPPGWLRIGAEQLRDQFASPPMIRDLASRAGVHPAYFTRTFRRHYGCSPGTYVRMCRVEWARAELMRAGTIAEVALRAGFADQAHFARAFKQATGVTPSDYRRTTKASSPSK